MPESVELRGTLASSLRHSEPAQERFFREPSDWESSASPGNVPGRIVSQV